MKILLGLLAAAALAAGQCLDATMTTSGLSAGAFFAVQMHVAFSRNFSGAGVVAGGPYYCSQGNIGYALTYCMTQPSFIDVAKLLSDAQSFSQGSQIDPLSFVYGSPVFLYSGTKDTVVASGVVSAAADLYQRMGAVVTFKNDVPSEHAMVTDDYGNACSFKGAPYINNCGLSLAGTLLSTVLGKSLHPRVAADPTAFYSYDQSKYLPSGQTLSTASLNSVGYAYVPKACMVDGCGARCPLHVVFHGCSQYPATIQETYVKHTDYAEWAEANGIVLLFPQAATNPSNPNGCFDWWGYTNANFAFQNGVQPSTVMRIIVAMETRSLKLTPA